MNILIAGLGSIAKKHISAIRRNGDHSIFALRSGRSPQHNEEGVGNVFSIEEAMAIKPDFAIISNPTSEHPATIERLLPMRIPLFIEKPAAPRADCIDRLVSETGKAGILTYIGCNLRFLGCLRFLKSHLETNPGHRVNEVNVYCGSDLRTWRPGTDFRKSYSAIPELGGGVNIDLIHDIDYTVWLFGRPQNVRAVCRSNSSLGIRATDYANFCLSYPGFCASVVLNYYRPDYRRSLEIVFDDTVWTADLASNRVTDHHGNTVFSSDEGILDTYQSQMDYFIRLVATGATYCENNLAAGAAILKICNANERPF